VLSSEGGSPRQLTFGPYHHGGRLAWTPDSKSLIFSANRQEDWEHDPMESELFELTVADGTLRQLTDRNGPDESPSISPDGRTIAYTGFDDQLLGYHTARLYLLDRDTRKARLVTGDFDRSVESPRFAHDGRGVFFQYDDQGNTKLGYVTLAGQRKTIAASVGGLSLGRPYSSGEFSVAKNGRLAFTQTAPHHPADLASIKVGAKSKRLTHLNGDLLPYKQLGQVEEIWYESSFDQRPVHAWIVKPPNFDADKKYPLILEIHGGPFANYGDRFSAEMQLYAAAGYVVLYVNPRGSTSYGAEFANLIHHNYPGQDYDDLMSGVDAVIKQGYIDTENLFVTGGSGGGVLTAWIIGHNDRFRAAVVAKPVINWYSFALTADGYNFFYKYWFPGPPWKYAEQYLSRSPISYVENVSTPTMLITGEADYRTPISETEQFYQALQLRKIESALVRIPGASHAIASRPSRLIAKAAHVLAWFERYRSSDDEADDE
jgi:acylaminoacyl-peptidase